MKIKTIFLAVLSLTSCGDGDLVRFEEPQPDGQSNEKQIPDRLIGEYFSLDDSARLTLTSAHIIKSSIVGISGEADSLDRKGIKGDTAYSTLEDNVVVNVRVQGDSVFMRWTNYDTLFDLTRGDILRKFKGHYFVNEKISANSWRVTTLTRIKNGVTLGTVSTREEISNLRAVTESPDTVFRFQPTKKELRQFLKRKGFSTKDTFVKNN